MTPDNDEMLGRRAAAEAPPEPDETRQMPAPGQGEPSTPRPASMLDEEAQQEQEAPVVERTTPMTIAGSVLGDRYRLDEVIGRGGMAEVWRARDVRLHRDVAVKRLRIDLATDPTFQMRFRREAQAAAGLNHPNIVAVYDTGEAPDPATDISVPYIVMELIEGHTLKDVLRDGRKILPERALEFVQGTLAALAYSHRAGIVHRDIKPANVMLTTGGVVKVMDFGIARAVSDTSATMTQTAAVIGTAQYLSPEQARGETVDNRSDIYSAGCLLYELLVGRPPFIGDSPVSVAYQHVRELPVPPSELDPEITSEMDAIVMKSLAKDPADRYQDADEMHDDIARLLAGEKVTAVIPPMVPLPPEPWQTQTPGHAALVGSAPSGAEVMTDDEDQPRRRALPIVLVALVLALLLALGFALWQVFKPVETPTVAQVQVPMVRGLSEDAARSTIVNAKLRVGTVDYVNRDDYPAGQVYNQNPAGQTMADEGSSVNIVVNLGPKTTKIPTGLVGMTATQAEAALKAAGFTVKKVDDNPESEPVEAAAGDVTNVSPAEGAEVDAGAEVTLTVATGMSIVPNLRGKDIDQATALAKQRGFTITPKYQATQNAVPGEVFEQTPADGTAADRSKPIEVTIAQAPPTPIASASPATTPPASSAPPSSAPPSQASPPASSTPASPPASTPGG